MAEESLVGSKTRATPRCIPAQLVHQLARKLQAKRLGTVAVL